MRGVIREMNICLKEVTYEEKSILRNLLELYMYELSVYEESIELNEQGLFGYRYLDHYWTEEERYPYFIYEDKKLVGFVLVRRIDYSGHQDYKWLIAEFFILKKYRRQGVGRTAVHTIFNMFTGNWIVSQIENNTISRLFWKNVIMEYTNGNFIDSHLGQNPAHEFISKG